MKLRIIYIAIFFTFLFDCKGQSFFNLNDSVFEVGEIIKIEITYQLSGGCRPTIESVPTLDSIFVFLKKNKNLKIEITANTDYRDDSIKNERISEMRARSVKDYFIEKGIESHRIEYKGYGENNPIIVDSKINEQFSFLNIGQKLTEEYINQLDTSEKQEIANMLNRRTEIKIIKKNWP